MKESILQGNKKKCYITGAEYAPLHKHHIYEGKNRQISDDNGFWVWLTPYWHNGSDFGVHGIYGRSLNLRLKKECQRAFEKTHSRKEFMRLIGRNYLDE